MLKIRLSRVGKKNQPSYRIIVTERRSKRDGKYIANLGNYTPYKNPAILKLDIEAYDSWLEKGAQPSDVVKNLRTKTTSDKTILIEKKPKAKAKKKTESN